LTDSVFRLALNDFAYHWSFPEIVADSAGLFEKRGMKVEWYDATPEAYVRKGDLYSELLRHGETDLYHAGEWACIERVVEHRNAVIVAKTPPSAGSLNSTFTIYVRNDSPVKTPKDLSEKKVAIEPGTGSYYTALQDLERYLPVDEISLVQGGEPHRRLLMLLRGDVEAASLLGPWTELADKMGMRALLRTQRTNSTASVTRRTQSAESLMTFFDAVNEAIGLVNDGGDIVRRLYFERFSKVLKPLPPEVYEQGMKLRDSLYLPKWSHWEPFWREDFNRAYDWMVERKLIKRGARYEDVSLPDPNSIFPSLRR
jgi:NitT/TauT family transport system substrate-binding protein